MNPFHKIIFWSHLLAGVSAGSVILMMSFTGVVLMYEPQITEYAEWRQRWVVSPSGNAPRLSLDSVLAKVREAHPDARPTAITVGSDPSASMIVSLGRENTVFVNPYTGELLGGLSSLHHFLREVVEWHRWFAMEGENRDIGRAVTGVCNLAFFWLAVTGVYLWWPRHWVWRGLKTSIFFNARLRGKARDWNWHNVIGFWSSSVLVILTLTGAVMSYPWANDLLYTLTGSEPPPRRGEGPVPPQKARGRASAARSQAVNLDAILAAAQQQVPGWLALNMRLAGRGGAPVAVSIQEPDAWNRFQRSQLTLDGATAEIIKWEPYAANSTGRKLRAWARGLHTGEALGFSGQTVAGAASLGGCFLVWTGIAMAWRRLRYRKREATLLPAVEPVTIEVTSKLASGRPAAQTNGSLKEASQIEMEATDPAASIGHSGNDKDGVFSGASTPFSRGNEVLILYGTVTGNAEAVANKLAATLRGTGIVTAVRDIARCRPRVLTQANCVLLVISTYGDGEPPDDATAFWDAVVNGNGLDLRGVKFSVLALGNTTYDNFCKCGRDFDAALERHGATRLHPRVDCDVDFEQPAAFWMDGVLSRLGENPSALSVS